MPHVEPTPLMPHGVRKLEVGTLRIYEAQDGKLVFALNGLPDRHWTLHPGDSSGVLDSHGTVQAPGGPLHRTLVTVDRKAFWNAVVSIAETLEPSDLIDPSRPSRLGW